MSSLLASVPPSAFLLVVALPLIVVESFDLKGFLGSGFLIVAPERSATPTASRKGNVVVLRASVLANSMLYYSTVGWCALLLVMDSRQQSKAKPQPKEKPKVAPKPKAKTSARKRQGSSSNANSAAKRKATERQLLVDKDTNVGIENYSAEKDLDAQKKKFLDVPR